MIHLDHDQVASLQAVQKQVLQQQSREAILQKCTLPFAKTYAGMLLAARDRVSDALFFLEQNKSDPYAFCLHDFLIRHKSLKPTCTTFADVSPYDHWVQTNFHKNYQPKVVSAIADFTKKWPNPGHNGSATIMDVGTGNGDLFVKIAKELIAQHQITDLHLIFVEPFEEMMKAAKKLCEEELSVSLRFTQIFCKAQDLTEDHIDDISHEPIWFINAAISIHHMPKEQKVPVLKLFKKLSPHCVISEVNWNHDLPAKDSPELLYSVAQGYGYACQDILNSPISDQGKRSCLDNILMAESIRIITEERDSRVDYHTTLAEWQSMTQMAGFENHEVRPFLEVGEFLYGFVMGM